MEKLSINKSIVECMDLLRYEMVNNGVSPADLMGRSRTKEVSEVRHKLFKLLYKEKGFTYEWIAEAFGRTHATVIHGVKVAKPIKEDTKGILKHETLYRSIRDIMQLKSEYHKESIKYHKERLEFHKELLKEVTDKLNGN